MSVCMKEGEREQVRDREGGRKGWLADTVRHVTCSESPGLCRSVCAGGAR